MGKKRILIVVGDTGGAKMMAPVIKLLLEKGQECDVVADNEGLAGNVFKQSGIEFEQLGIKDFQLLENRVASKKYSLAFIGTCAHANKLELKCAEKMIFYLPVIFGSDGYFNHSLPVWREINPDTWIAIDKAHQKAILDSHPLLTEKEVVALGQPAFDPLLELMPQKNQIRQGIRRDLNIGTECAVLWWSQGTEKVMEPDLKMTIDALRSLPDPKNCVFIPRIHPQADKNRKGFKDFALGLLRNECDRLGLRIINGDTFPTEHLCLAADVILSITCTEDIKSTLMGGPPVIHMLRPDIRAWMEEDLSLRFPYLPDVGAQQNVAVFEEGGFPDAFAFVLDPKLLDFLKSNREILEEPATDKIATYLARMADIANPASK